MIALTADNLLNLWRRVSMVPGGKRLFHLGLKRAVPYTGALGAELVEMAPGHVKVRLRDRRGVRNHLNSVHAMALANLGEMASGLAMLTSLPEGMRGILKGFEIEYLKKARGTLTAECRVEPQASTEQRELPIHAEIKDEKGDVVTRVKANWLVGPKNP